MLWNPYRSKQKLSFQLFVSVFALNRSLANKEFASAYPEIPSCLVTAVMLWAWQRDVVSGVGNLCTADVSRFLPCASLFPTERDRETVITQESYMTWFIRACNALSQKEKGSREKIICSLRLTWAIVTSHTPDGEFSSCIPAEIPLWGCSLSPWPSTAQELDDAVGSYFRLYQGHLVIIPW